MGLQLYNEKRNFRNTPEPRGRVARSKSKLEFVIQRHKASHLHYDLRLEIDGVMKSWAVPKGPSLNPGDKRLAMMVEDHPMDYNKFEGVIPEGNYGAGIVEIWDKGTYSDIDNLPREEAEKKLRAGLKAGNLKFTLYGKKLKGEFALVRLKKGGDNSWLLIKHRDEHATDEPYNSEEQTPKNSPINKWLAENKKPGRTKRKSSGASAPAKKKIPDPLSATPKRQKASRPTRHSAADTTPGAVKARRVRALPAETRKLQHYIAPMLAKEADAPFSDPDWIFEMKWDGYRAVAELNGHDVRLYSRNGNTFNASYPVVVQALQELNLHAVIDGEIVVMDEDGKSDFQRLQYYQTDSNHPMEYRVFDVIAIDGEDLTQLPLVERKERLKELLPASDVVKYSDHIEERGEDFFTAAQGQNLEGIIAKKADSLYHIGKRTSEWLKIKNHKTTDVIVAGFTAPGGSRQHFGALILAAYEGTDLKYIGHTGTGFNTKGLSDLYKRLKPHIIPSSPLSENIRTNTPATWVKPIYVAEVKFTEWTKDGSLRHPVFLRIRDDKKPKDVTMSAVRPVAKAARKTTAKKSVPVKAAAEKRTSKKTVTGKSVTKKNVKKKADAKDDSSSAVNEIAIGKHKVRVTNLQKIYWPGENITKGDMINYYISVADYILPFLKGRPQSLKRNPNGIMDSGFYHKDAGDEAPSFVKTKEIYSESAEKDIDYIVCNNAATLTYLNNLGCIEINPWHSTINKLDQPDYIVIDIDPSDKNTFAQVIETAQVINGVLKRAGVKGYCKTSGATGLHVYIPTAKQYTYEQLKDFAHIICILVQEELPDYTTLERNLRKRGDKRIYLDHLQNRRGQTISSVYSLRPKPGAPVSMPLDWKEVKPGLDPRDFNIHNALKRIEKKKGAFREILGPGIDLLKALKKLGA